MKEVVVLSGKGGTGKTTLVGSLASLVERKVLADCDVDAADLHLLLNPTSREESDFWSGQVAFIDPGKCLQCGLCQDVCRFGAVNDFTVDPVSCEGCGFCSRVCPGGAITMNENLSGQLFLSETRYGLLVHARLGIAQENSGKLVSQVRQRARQIAEEQQADYIISDGPPGTGCPVISSLSGADLAILVTEPTLSGMHDLERITGVCAHFGVPPCVCINKFDINEENTREIERYCAARDVSVIARIPFDNAVTRALINGVPVVEYMDGAVSRKIEKLWQTASGMLERSAQHA